MPDLKSLRSRIRSVKSTQKITKAMKMVAASKLRRAQARAEEARPYSERMERMLLTLAASTPREVAPALLAGRKDEEGNSINKVHLIIVTSSDRGLCGGFNSNIVRAVKRRITALEQEGKTVKLLMVGKKGYEQLKYTHKDYILERVEMTNVRDAGFEDADMLSRKVIELFESGQIDSCSLVYNQFLSILSQKVAFQSLIPLELEVPEDEKAEKGEVQSVYEYEPDEETILEELLPRNISVQIFHALLENAASVQAARMTAMDNATRNADDMIRNLTLQYNRTRQAVITKELIEIISGAEAL